MSVIKRIALLTVLLMTCLPGAAEEEFSPSINIHGALRTRWEMNLDDDASRFQVRNARVTLDGAIAPSIDYFIQTDLCNQGKMQILDAWGRIGITDHLKFQAGQFRMPFGVDCFRAPSNYIFANRSFIGKQFCNVRAVGAKLSYIAPVGDEQELTVEAGAFNPTVITDHSKWVKTMAYAGKVAYRVKNMKFSAGVQSLEPDSIRYNLIGASASWTCGRWLVEGEYMNKHYTHKAYKSANVYNIYADYHFPVNLGVFNQASVQARFDALSDHSNGVRSRLGKLTTSQSARQRITVGGTLTYTYKKVHCDVRLDYEKYFYDDDNFIIDKDCDKIVAEMVIRF